MTKWTDRRVGKDRRLNWPDEPLWPYGISYNRRMETRRMADLEREVREMSEQAKQAILVRSNG